MDGAHREPQLALPGSGIVFGIPQTLLPANDSLSIDTIDQVWTMPTPSQVDS
jgi:hypothetical protein